MPYYYYITCRLLLVLLLLYHLSGNAKPVVHVGLCVEPLQVAEEHNIITQLKPGDNEEETTTTTDYLMMIDDRRQ